MNYQTLNFSVRKKSKYHLKFFASFQNQKVTKNVKNLKIRISNQIFKIYYLKPMSNCIKCEIELF